MATDEKRPYVEPNVAFEGLTFAPMPEGTRASAVLAMVHLEGSDDFEWCVRTAARGTFDRSAFLGQLSAYVHSLLVDEARQWEEDEDDNLPPSE